MKLNELYGGGDRTFRVTVLELKDGDPWVTYINTQTLQEYSCRQEAFLSRFSQLPQPR
jgi:hypothetical protein